MSNINELFGLTLEQTIIMQSMQYRLISADIASTEDEAKKAKKRRWRHKWEKSVGNFLKHYQDKKAATEGNLIKNQKELLDLIKSNMKTTEVKTPYYLILLELTLFGAYYPLNEDQKPEGCLKFKADKDLLVKYAKAMKLDPEMIDKFRSGYKTSIRGITKYWEKILIGGGIGAIVIAVTAGFAAPAIGAIVAAEGLAGAAATAAGLATLGGGAIAAGGLGMAGGIAVIIGGGAILGGIMGTATGRLLVENPGFVMSQAAKMEVVMKEIVLLGQKDIRLAQELLKGQRQAISDLEQEVLKLKENREKNKVRIEKIEKSIKYLTRAADRNRKYVDQVA